jgi:hypothetical protein
LIKARTIRTPPRAVGRGIFESWDVHEMDELVRLMRKFADAVSGERPAGS